MKKYDRRNLNVRRLLALGILDIRGMAARNEALTANEYFTKVEIFIENAPAFYNDIANISKLGENIRALKELEEKLGIEERPVVFTEDTKTLRDLESLKNILSEIGYAKLDFGLDNICFAIKNSNLQLVEKLAPEVAAEFNMLYNTIKSTYSTKKFTTAQAEAADGSDNRILLKEALDCLDYEEANRKLRILAVDDVSIVLNALSSILSPYYEVFALKNPSQIGKFLTHTTPELFLLDIEMSEVSGFELIPLIRRFEEHRDTPIIFLTGNSSYNNLRDAIAVGACDFITKPVNKEILLEKIRKNIVRKKAY